MTGRLAVPAVLVPLLLAAQGPALEETVPHGTTPKEKPSEYPVETAAGNYTLAAEYLVHSFQGRKQTFFTKDYLVIEVAFYGPRYSRLQVSSGHFTLRMNGKKFVLFPQTASFVAAALRYEDWETRPRVMAGGGVGDRGVILGGPRAGGRFPGDPRGRVPNPPKAPDTTPGGVEREEAPRADEVAIESALQEGEQVLPVSGYLYFAFKGKTKSIQSLELIYKGPAGEVNLRLF